MSKPSDLIPELQGRFPIRVELKSLGEGDFQAYSYRTQKRPRKTVCCHDADRRFENHD